METTEKVQNAKTATSTATKWVLEPTHSEVLFKAKHLMITNVTGNFKAFTATVETEDAGFTKARISFSAETGSVNTNNEQRDGHLKGADFFDSANYPQLKFEAENFNAKEGKVNGTLTIKNVSKPISLDVEFAGTNKDPWGNEKAGFSISGKINRSDWGLTWNAPLEAGGLLVSEEVKINAEVQFVKQA